MCSQTGWQKKVLPATADVAKCEEVERIWNTYDAWCKAMNVPRADHGIVTVYSDGEMNIDYHYDKIRTIASDSLILIVKTGEEGRPFHIRQRLYAPWADEVPEAHREEKPLTKAAATKAQSAFLKQRNAVKPFFNKVVPPGDALIMTIPANLATEHAVPPVEHAAGSGSIVLRTVTEVVPYQQALDDAATTTAAAREGERSQPQLQPVARAAPAAAPPKKSGSGGGSSSSSGAGGGGKRARKADEPAPAPAVAVEAAGDERGEPLPPTGSEANGLHTPECTPPGSPAAAEEEEADAASPPEDGSDAADDDEGEDGEAVRRAL